MIELFVTKPLSRQTLIIQSRIIVGDVPLFQLRAYITADPAKAVLWQVKQVIYNQNCKLQHKLQQNFFAIYRPSWLLHVEIS
jgi:hypothetical protein